MHTNSVDFSLELLRKDLPEQYRIWVWVGVLSGLFGYLATTIVQILQNDLQYIFSVTDPYVVLVDLIALGVLLSGRAGLAVGIVLVGLWFDIHVSIVTIGDPTEVFSLLVIPIFIMCVGLLFGCKAVFASACLTMVTIPLAIFLPQIVETGPGFGASGSLLLLVIIEVVLLVTTLLVIVFLRSLAFLFEQSHANEIRTLEFIESAPDAIVVFSSDDKVEAFNQSARQLMHLTQEEAFGRRHTELPLCHPEGIWLRGLDELAALKDPIELNVCNEETQLEAMFRSISQPGGEQDFVVVLRDITSRRRAESKAQTLQEQLLHAQKLEAVGRLAGGIAHDFNNILTGVSGYGYLLSESDDSETREIGEELMDTQKRGATLIRQLLAFARKDMSQPRPMDLARTVRGLSNLLERLVGETVQLDIQIFNACPIVADPGKIEQIVLNLATNARDAMPDGGILSIYCEASDDRVTLSVSDTGIGMSKETKVRIFDPFFTTKKRGKGTGLGLSMVHGIVVESDGTIDVETAEGKGTCITMTWPITDGKQSTVPPEPSAASIDGDGRNVFVVEDNIGARTFLDRFLRRKGFSVELAEDGEVALDVLMKRAEPPDLILTDVVMPRMNGPDFVKQLRTRWPGVPALFMSGYLGEAWDEFEFDPIEDLIRKPFSSADLIACVAAKLKLGDEEKNPRSVPLGL